MKQTNKLSQAGRSSLQDWSKGLPSDKAEKNVLMSFKAGSALNKQLMKQHPKQVKAVSATKQLIEQAHQAKQYQKLHAVSQNEKLMAEVKNLSDFKPTVTREKTKLMVEQIIANKRQQHLRCLNQFLEQTQQSYSLAKEIEDSTKSEKLEFFNINRKQFQEFTASLTDSALLTKDKSLLAQISNFINENQIRRKERLDGVRESLLSLYSDLKERFKGLTVSLQEQFREIAFVLEGEANSICTQQLKRLDELCESSINGINTFVDTLITSSEAEFNQLKSALSEKADRWKVVNKQHSIEQFTIKLVDPLFCKTTSRTALFNDLKIIQEKVHNKRQALVGQLFSIDPNSLSKQQVDKWLEAIKNKSQEANKSVDALFNKLLAQIASNKQRGLKQLQILRERLLYIEADQPAITVELLAQKCEPLINKNEEDQKQLLSKAIEYVEKYESAENDVCQNIGKWMALLGTKNDEHKKKLEQQKQGHEISKAKILDDDEEKIDKLKEELQEYKKELKESLHHPKLEEIQAKCFAKVEELEQHYRQVYEGNKTLVANHPQLISKFYDKVQREIVEIFNLVDQSRKGQFITKVKANYEKLALKQIQKEDQLKAQEEARVRQEESKKKGGKAPPPPKPKDPKKAAAELQQRKQQILQAMGTPAINQMVVNGKSWIVEKNVLEMCREFYTGYVPDVQNPPEVDKVEQPVRDVLNEDVVSRNVMISVSTIKEKMEEYRDRVFERMVANRGNTVQKEAEEDKKYLAESLQTLDERLKNHYPLKSIIQSEIIGKRSTEINAHKKRYERHARATREKVDEQTEKFNLLMQKSLEVTKTYNEQRKVIKEQLANVKNVANFQGISRKARESNDSLENSMKQILKELKKLAGSELDTLMTRNEDFLKQISGSSEYAKQELQWYTNMMNEISTQLKQQKQKRAEKVLQIENHTKKKKQELNQVFEKEYSVGMDDMAAKDCAGNKYGKPKMIAQERLRMEMSKCEKAQENINKLMESLRDRLQQSAPLDTLQLRELLMTIRTCMGKYAKHIQALKPDAKVGQMTRVNYALSRSDTAIVGTEKDEDQKRRQKQLQAIGSLSEQKDDRKYNPSIADISRVVKEQVAKIYVGDKAKFLNADKIPDNLQEYLQTIKKNAEAFRLNSIRQLRSSCNQLAELAKKVSERIFQSLKDEAQNNQNRLSTQCLKSVQSKRSQNEGLKNLHMKRLSPNLANPASRKELLELDQKQTARLPEYKKFVNQSKNSIFSDLFQNSSSFLNSTLNNFEFLMLYYDSLYLPQDFIQLPGDETNEKKHLNLKQLMLMKEKGVVVDTTSQRNVTKKWQGLKFDVFDKEGNKFVYAKTEVEEPKDNKKAAKKEAKDPKKEQPPSQQVKVSKQIQSIKTPRQKSAFVQRNSAYQQLVESYNRQTQKFSNLFSRIEEEEGVFSAKWKDMVQRLKKASQ